MERFTARSLLSVLSMALTLVGCQTVDGGGLIGMTSVGPGVRIDPVVQTYLPESEALAFVQANVKPNPSDPERRCWFEEMGVLLGNRVFPFDNTVLLFDSLNIYNRVAIRVSEKTAFPRYCYYYFARYPGTNADVDRFITKTGNAFAVLGVAVPRQQ